MSLAFIWCPHCKKPHLFGQSKCPTTGLAIEQNAHRLRATTKHPLVDQVIDGGYRVIERIASGGCATIFEAEDLRLRRRVAVKVLKDADSEEAAERLAREAVFIASVQHPNVCKVHSTGKLPDGTPYIVMELLEGETLAERIRATGAMSVFNALDLMDQTLSGLQAVHAAGLIHRDMKPGNLFLVEPTHDSFTPDPTRPLLHSVIKLLDFGWAREVRHSSWRRLTIPGRSVGTMAYGAPEVSRGESATVTCDIFGCGLVLFEMLAGRRAYDGKTAIEVADAIRANRRIRVSQASPNFISSELDALVECALEPDPRNRFQSARDMRRALRSVMRDVDGPSAHRRDHLSDEMLAAAPVSSPVPASTGPSSSSSPTSSR